MQSNNFYKNLPTLNNFEEFPDSQNFVELPSDWTIIITDIIGSTRAISEGRYKDVNTLGAATIVVATKALNEVEFPFVFGGDGATLLVPVAQKGKVLEALAGLRELAKVTFDLELRVGSVDFLELKSQGMIVKVAKLEITPGKNMALIQGDGIQKAEELIKGVSNDYKYTGEIGNFPSLNQLSCRWNPIPSQKGKILTLMVSSRKGNDVYSDFLKHLNKVFPEGLDDSNPVNVKEMYYKKAIELIKEERKLHKSAFSPLFWARCMEILIAVLIFRYKIPPLVFNAKKYFNSMRTHSDFRKFDDVLRMVIDCSVDQMNQIKIYLSEQHKQGNLFFGTFESDMSLMTCFIQSGLGQGEHIHFIDAYGGGYVEAAKMLKLQIKKN